MVSGKPAKSVDLPSLGGTVDDVPPIGLHDSLGQRVRDHLDGRRDVIPLLDVGRRLRCIGDAQSPIANVHKSLLNSFAAESLPARCERMSGQRLPLVSVQ